MTVKSAPVSSLPPGIYAYKKMRHIFEHARPICVLFFCTRTSPKGAIWKQKRNQKKSSVPRCVRSD